ELAREHTAVAVATQVSARSPDQREVRTGFEHKRRKLACKRLFPGKQRRFPTAAMPPRGNGRDRPWVEDRDERQRTDAARHCTRQQRKIFDGTGSRVVRGKLLLSIKLQAGSRVYRLGLPAGGWQVRRHGAKRWWLRAIDHPDRRRTARSDSD